MEESLAAQFVSVDLDGVAIGGNDGDAHVLAGPGLGQDIGQCLAGVFKVREGINHRYI